MKKPTGKPGEKNDRILRCIAIEHKIMKKMHTGMMGINESKDEEEVADGGERVMFLIIHPQRHKQIIIFVHGLH